MLNIALCGNPNCGKTTLMNRLTGTMLPVGNWPGVTVQRQAAALKLSAREALLQDLPGLYSLGGYSVEERVAADYLRSGEPDIVLNVVDSTTAERGLALTLELIEAGFRVLVALNMADELRAGGGRVNADALAEALGAEVVLISASSGEGVDGLMAALNRVAAGGSPMAAEWSYPVSSIPFNEYIGAASARFRRIDAALASAHYVPPAKSESRLDALALNKVSAYPIFAALMALTFMLAFGWPGAALTGLFEGAVRLITAVAGAALRSVGAAGWLRSLIVDGAMMGVGSVICFMPQIIMLFLMLTLLEDSGYMARASLIWDRPLSKIGLSGRSFAPLLMGFGCTTSATVSARSVDDERDRLTTIMLLPFMSCGAKLPVYALFAGAFFGKRAPLVVLGLYVLGMALMALTGKLAGRMVGLNESPFVLELPPYRMPGVRSVIKRLRRRAREFLVRAGTLIFIMSLVVYALQSVTPGFKFAASGSDSIFAHMASALSPAFAPLGLGDWRIVAALMSGLVAKEAVVATVAVLFGAGNAAALPALLTAALDQRAALAFLVFVLLYPPCLSAIAAMRRELGSRRLLWQSIAIQLALAYALALIVRTL